MCNCNEILKIKFSKEHDCCVLPSKRLEDAGYDLYADPSCIDDFMIIENGSTAMIPTGIRSIIPSSHYAQIQERGSTGVKGMKYGAGVIDSGFTGVWNVVITNCNKNRIVLYDDNKNKDLKELYKKVANEIGSSALWAQSSSVFYPISKAIAQFVLLPVPKTVIEEVSKEEIIGRETLRGEGKLGSSGK